MSDFLSNCLIHKPDDIFKFTKEYFSKFGEKSDLSRCIIIVGPHGVGKNSLIKKLQEKFPQVKFPNQYTTKTKVSETRGDESNLYHISKEEFLAKITKGDFLNYNLDNGDYYGVTYDEIEKISNEQNICLMQLEISTAKKVYYVGKINAFYVSVFPPNLDVLRERLRKQNRSKIEEINKLLHIAQKQILEMKESNIFNYSILNDDFSIACENFNNILLSAFPDLNKELLDNLEDLKSIISEYDNTKQSS
jgi:guanylate kinase